MDQSATEASVDFNSMTFISDPWAAYQYLRNSAPVAWLPSSNSFFVSKYADVSDGLSDRRLVAGFPLRASRRLFGRTGVDSDGPDHRVFRKLFAPLFSSGSLQRLSSDMLRPAVDDALNSVSGDQLPDWATAEITDHVAVSVPYGVITRLMGCPVEDAAWLRERILPLSRAIEFPAAPLAPALAARDELLAYLKDVVPNRPRRAHVTLLDLVCGAETQAESSALYTAVLFFAAGTETSVIAIRKIINVLRNHNIELGALADSSYRAQVIRETLRWDPPSHTVVRYAARDMVIRDIPIPRRSAILLSLASANRDDEAYVDASVWRPARAERRNLSFSAGPHSCIGMQLALAEFDLLLDELSTRYGEHRV